MKPIHLNAIIPSASYLDISFLQGFLQLNPRDRISASQVILYNTIYFNSFVSLIKSPFHILSYSKALDDQYFRNIPFPALECSLPIHINETFEKIERNILSNTTKNSIIHLINNSSIFKVT